VTKSSAIRLFRNLIVGILATLFFLIVAIRVQQYVLRAHAERLLGQVRALDLGRATFADAQQIFRQWPSARDEGPCVPIQCDFAIRLSDLCDSHLGSCLDYPQLRRVYESLGGRSATVTADVSVRDGLVENKAFRVNILVSPQETDLFGPFGYSLIGRASTSQASETRSWPTGTSRHPEYYIGQPSGCEICVSVYTVFTPYADPTDIQRLMQFNLSCLTRWRSPCRTQGDIMPAAWKEAQDDRTGLHP
jgi:hypothetical protein